MPMSMKMNTKKYPEIYGIIFFKNFPLNLKFSKTLIKDISLDTLYDIL